jgi:hypothetical protein
MPSRLGHIHAESVESLHVHTDSVDVKNLTVKQSMNLASDLSTSGSITSTGSISAEEVSTTTLKIGGATQDFSSFLTSVTYADIQNKPTYLLDWSIDQGDTNIDSNNIPLLNYASNALASNGAAGLSNYNFNQARKVKLEGIETGAQVNPSSTDNLAEGSSNLYFTNSRAQSAFTVANNLTSVLNGVSYPNGGLNLTGGVLTYMPPVPPDLTPYAPKDSPQFTGNVSINGNALVEGDGALTEINFTSALNTKLANIADNADITPSWVPTTNPNYLTTAQAPLETPVITAPSGNGNLTLTSNIGFNTLLTYTPPAIFTPVAGTGISLSGNTISVNAQAALQGAPNRSIHGLNFTRLTVNLNPGWFDTGWPFFVNAHAYINTLYVGSAGAPVTSDDRLKHNETDITNGLAVIRKLQPQTYQKTNEMKAADFKGEIQGEWHWECGLIAQDVLKIPELKHCVFRGDYTDDSGKFIEREYFVRYNDIFTHNIAATKELDEKVTTLEATIQDLLKRIEVLESK